MKYCLNINDIVEVNSIIKSQSRIVDRLKKETCLYQVEILEGKYKNQQLWFAEAEIKKD